MAGGAAVRIGYGQICEVGEIFRQCVGVDGSGRGGGCHALFDELGGGEPDVENSIVVKSGNAGSLCSKFHGKQATGISLSMKSVPQMCSKEMFG